MSIKVCGLLELSDVNMQHQEKVQLFFLVVEKATKNMIGINFGNNVFSKFLKKCDKLPGKIPFELVDYPTDTNAECLFKGDGIELYVMDVRIDTEECLFARMMRVQDFLDELLKTKLINRIVLELDEVDFDEDNFESIEIAVSDFCRKMLELYERENNWTPTVRIVIYKNKDSC